MERVLITGVAGFIGSHVARRFIHEGIKVFGVDDLSVGTRDNLPAEVDFLEGDLSDPAVFGKIPVDCRKILHLAGQSSGEISFDNPVADLEKNVGTTLRLLQFAHQQRVERLVYASSMSVYGKVPDKPIPETHPCEPLSCYGVGKLAAERYLKIFENRVPWTSLRMFNVYGPGQDLRNLRQGMVSIYLAQALQNRKIEVKGSLDRFRDFIFIEDVVEAWFRASLREAAVGRSINLGTGIRTSVRELVQEIEKFFPGIPVVVQESTPGDQFGIFADTSLLQKSLGLEKTTPLVDGLRRFFEFAKKRHPLAPNSRAPTGNTKFRK